MFNIIDNKTASNNRNTAAATVTSTPFTGIPAKVDDILPYMTAPAAFDIGVQTAQSLCIGKQALLDSWSRGALVYRYRRGTLLAKVSICKEMGVD